MYPSQVKISIGTIMLLLINSRIVAQTGNCNQSHAIVGFLHQQSHPNPTLIFETLGTPFFLVHVNG